ncbi:hypothetical protein CCUS01_14955 [Colletotrichum cuscutae]|uniref:Uncharacterized protein n=1 Tax=Colletotrichum cuscutae TaxID=1209917 RepID=A0AAI9VI47_9PEZI|nr:hypothetical protein CCUS01_14955 [Colletotrichum cuscutae]
MPGLESENRGQNDMMGVGAETVKEISQPAVAYLASVEPSFSACLTLLRASRCSHVCEVATCGGKLGRRGRHRPCGEISDDADEVRLFLGANRMTQKIPIGWERKKKEEKEKISVVQEMELEKDVPTRVFLGEKQRAARKGSWEGALTRDAHINGGHSHRDPSPGVKEPAHREKKEPTQPLAAPATDRTAPAPTALPHRIAVRPSAGSRPVASSHGHRSFPPIQCPSYPIIPIRSSPSTTSISRAGCKKAHTWCACAQSVPPCTFVCLRLPYLLAAWPCLVCLSDRLHPSRWTHVNFEARLTKPCHLDLGKISTPTNPPPPPPTPYISSLYNPVQTQPPLSPILNTSHHYIRASGRFRKYRCCPAQERLTPSHAPGLNPESPKLTELPSPLAR